MLAAIRRVLREGRPAVIETMHRDRLVEDGLGPPLAADGRGPAAARAEHVRSRVGVAQTTQTLIDGDGQRESRTFSVRVYTATSCWR